MIMGAVLAGGMSTRFGSDKALAELEGRSLLGRAVDALNAQCDLVIIVGREAGPAFCLPDWPRAGMGPLGGVAAALRHAQDMGYASVVTCGVDCADLPDNLVLELSPPNAYIESQPVIGHWASDTAETVEAILQSEGRHSMLAFAQSVHARAVTGINAPANINTPADLAALEHR